MKSLLLPFARRLSDSQLVSPMEVVRGLACGCVCPGCQYTVQARQGTEKAWHFAHAEGAPFCGKGYEISVHEMAKQMLYQGEGGQLRLPSVIAEASGLDDQGAMLLEKEEIGPEVVVTIGESRTSMRLEDVTPDVTLLVNGVALCVEIVVFHRLAPSKRERLVGARLPSILIDLSLFKELHADREALTYHLFENPNNRLWLFHPDIARVQAILEARIQGRIEEARRRHLEAQEVHRQNEERWEQQRRLLAALPRPTSIQPPEEKADEAPSPRWRASFPQPERISAATEMLAGRINVSAQSIQAVMADVTRRSHLSAVTPREVSERWASRLNCAESEVFQFLFEADFLIE